METTIYIEIPVTVKFDVDPGQTQTHWEPGYPPQVEDVRFDQNELCLSAIREVEKYLEDAEEELLEAAEEQARDAYEYHAEMLYEEHKERVRGMR